MHVRDYSTEGCHNHRLYPFILFVSATTSFIDDGFRRIELVDDTR